MNFSVNPVYLHILRQIPRRTQKKKGKKKKGKLVSSIWRNIETLLLVLKALKTSLWSLQSVHLIKYTRDLIEKSVFFVGCVTCPWDIGSLPAPDPGQSKKLTKESYLTLPPR